MTGLKISPTLTLPVDFATKTAAILAQRRVGKSYLAAVLAEEMVAAEMPFVLLDPTGAHWGLRASADGQRSGLPVVIFGGDHGDVPLERGAGKFVAELVVDEPGYYVIDFSAFESLEAQRQFTVDFGERIYRAKREPRDFPMHLFVDEADLFVPQQVRKNSETSPRLLGAFEAIVRRGGIRGLGTTLISQRAAVVNKNVLEQIDVLIVMRTIGPNDRKAIDGYIASHGTAEQREQLLGSLPSLERGEAWIWEPGEDLFERVRIRERRTFNSSATPKVGEKRIEPRQLAPVDLEAIKERMAATIERAKAEDPRELQRRIRELERDLRNAPSRVERATPVVERVEVPVLLDGDAVRLQHVAGATAEAMQLLGSVLEEMRSKLEQLRSGTPASVPPTHGSGGRSREGRVPTGPTAAQEPTRGVPVRPTLQAGTIGRAERAILSVLAQYPNGRTYNQIALLTGYSARASTIGVALSKLRRLAYATDGQPVRATPDGLTAIEGQYEPLPTGPALLEHWRNQLGKAERATLDILVDAYPNPVTQQQIADQTGYSARASTIGVALSKLRRLELADGWRASDDFMEAIR